MGKSNVDRLIEEGIIAKDYALSDEDRDALEGLSDEELQALIDLRNKLGDEFIGRHFKAGFAF